MNLDELQSVRETERSKTKLQQLSESFYDDVGELVRDRRNRRNRVASDSEDPYGDPDIVRLNDEITAIERTMKAIYERRVGKIIKQAGFAASGIAASDDNLTPEERELYSAMVDQIEENRRSVLALVVGDGDTPERDSQNQDGTRTDSVDLSEESTRATNDSIHRTTVKITAEIGEIVGIDERTYDLATDDVVTLPSENAKPLIERSAATPIE